MMKKPVDIAQLGDSILRLKAKNIDQPDSKATVAVIERMLDILSSSNGVGLAAPQIFESICILVIASRPSNRYPLAPEMEPVVMLNPSFKALSQTKRKDWEGCLSIPGIRALVARFEKIKITYLDRQGERQEWGVDDFIARIFQHEYDHLQGLVYLDRVEDNKDIIAESEFQKLMEKAVD
jgi:peptide deformylase